MLITKEIKKKHKSFFSNVMDLILPSLPEPKPLQQHSVYQQKEGLTQFMSKQGYNEWINKISAEWPLGRRVYWSVMKNHSPAYVADHYMVVNSFVEMKALAKWSSTYHQFRSVTVVRQDGRIEDVAPDELRFLTDEEEALAHAKTNKKQEASNVPVVLH